MLWRRATLGAQGALATTVLAWQLLPVPTVKTLVTAAVLCIPIALPLRGLAVGRRYTYRWATLCVLPYFIVGLTEAIANAASRWWSLAVLVCALLWFVALVAFIRVTADNQPEHH